MSEPNKDFRDFFETAFGLEPFDYQTRLATDEVMPSLVNVPTGAGKTAAVLGAWLWRRLQSNPTVGRRLIYCLPMRTLVEQTHRVAIEAVKRLGLQDRFGIHVLMGGDVDNEWEAQPERECLLIGTQDMLLSRALNRGYAMSRFKWPIHYGLLNNDCLWVFDEVQLMSDGLATSTQLAAFREQFRTFGPCHSIWMSATLDREWLKTVDWASHVDALTKLELSETDRATPILEQRLNARKIVEQAPPDCRTPNGLADFIKRQHKPGTQTLAVVNRVARARELYSALSEGFSNDELKLMHSRFRPKERALWATMLDEKPAGNGKIIIATQVIEAGVDISSRLLITDLAPYASLVQRFGRCNRTGEPEEALIYWVDLPLDQGDAKLINKEELGEKELRKIALPYDWENLKTAKGLLQEMQSGSPADLEKIAHHDQFAPAHVLRRRDLIDLFDTTPDLSGFDLDVSRFVRGGDVRDVSVAWRNLNGQEPTRHEPRLAHDELCPVSIGEFREFIKTKETARRAWRWDALDGEWQKISEEELRPGLTLLVDVKAGGYDQLTGWDKNLKRTVPVVEVETDQNDALNDDPDSFKRYVQTLAAHSREARTAAEAITQALSTLALDEYRDELVIATHHHDWGKAHEVFQETLHRGMEDSLSEVLLAKSDRSRTSANGKRGHQRSRFRHELASALALLQTDASDLVVYLAACHHGKVRLSIRALPGEDKPDDREKKFARGIWDNDELPALDLGDLTKPAVTLDLEPMLLGASEDGARSWLERMITLRDRVGVFRLAFLEALIRAADVRASSNPQDYWAKETV
ncbi:MAG: CRISPR-associated helicase Cas3' [Acidobacteriota bacterium]